MNEIILLLIGLALGCSLAAWYFRRRRRREARFLSFVAHEMNSPLASLNMTILNFVEGVFGPLPREHMQWIYLLKEQASRLGFLVAGYQDFIHMQYHRDFRLHPEPMDISALLRETVSGMEGSITRSGARVDFKGLSGPVEIFADRDRLQRALASIVEHAKKFRTDGPIEIAVESAATMLNLTIGYQGQKLKPSEITEMLKLYYPVDRKDQLLPCVGLGLGATRMLVEAHGGRLGLESDEAGYNRIRIELPIAISGGKN